MINQFKYLIFSSVILLVSCEKVIDVDIIDAEQQVIVECVLKDRPGESFILLSRSGVLSDDSDFEKISGANIKVSDKDGLEYLFNESLAIPGRYESPLFEVMPLNNYELDLLVDGKQITSVSPTFSKPIIDSLTYFNQGLFSSSEEPEYLITYHSTDPAGEKNNYRVRIWVNEKETNIYYLGNDDFIDGQNIEGPFLGMRAGPQDTIFVEVMSMDDSMYRYYTQLSSNLDQSQFSAAPSNPDGNLEGDAIGYFGVFTTDTMTLYLP